MDFIKQYQDKKKEISTNYIDACLFIKSYADASQISISEIATAMKYINLHEGIDSYTFDNQLNYSINNKKVLERLLDEVIDYGQLYKGSIKESTYNKFKSIKVKLKDLDAFEAIDYPPKTISTQDVANESDSLLPHEEKANKIHEMIINFDEIYGYKSIYNQTYFSPFEACCVIAKVLPRHMMGKIGAFKICKEWKFLDARDYIKKNLMNGRLKLTEEILGIESINLKTTLFEDKIIIEGFNDDILLAIYDECINPVIIFENTEDLFSNGQQKLTFRIPSELEDNIMQSYPMKLEKKIKELEEQLEGSNNLLTSQKIYSLIAVLKDLLINPDITGFIFSNSGNDNAKRKPTQGVLAKRINDMNISSLSERNVNGLFSIANDVLQDVKKNIET